MIHRCRPDVTIASLCNALRGEPTAEGLPKLGGRNVYRVPAAREGLLWLLRRAGVGAGDEVALPTLICDIVADSILAAGARPVTFGVSSEDFTPCAEWCEQALSPATKAVVLPHLYGIPADLAAFAELCARNGCLLIEDCAPCVLGRSGERDVGSIGHGSLYSFQYDKPLALGWGGAITLSAEMRARTGEPELPPMSQAEDRLLAASFLVQHLLTDSDRLGPGFLSMTFALDHLRGRPGAVDEVLSRARGEDVQAELTAWCKAHVHPPSPSALARVLSPLRRLVKRLVPSAVKRLAGTRPGPSPFAGKTLLPGGLGERLLAAQHASLAEGSASAARAKIAAIYQSGLDREKILAPSESCSPRHWLRFPIALRNGRRRDALVERAARELEVEIGPFTWPTPLHHVPHLRGKVRVGPGSRQTAAMMKGLLNLPVHAQMTEEHARRLVDFLNRA